MNKYKIRISVKGFFFNSKGEVLLIEGLRKEKGESYLCAPGGGVEDKESLEKALERELIEETGYTGGADKIVFCQDYQNPDMGRNFEIFMVGKIDEEVERVDSEDHKSKFITKEEFENIEFYPKGINPFLLQGKEGIEYGTYL